MDNLPAYATHVHESNARFDFPSHFEIAKAYYNNTGMCGHPKSLLGLWVTCCKRKATASLPYRYGLLFKADTKYIHIEPRKLHVIVGEYSGTEVLKFRDTLLAQGHQVLVIDDLEWVVLDFDCIEKFALLN